MSPIRAIEVLGVTSAMLWAFLTRRRVLARHRLMAVLAGYLLGA